MFITDTILAVDGKTFLMKKLLGIVVLGLLLSSKAFSKNLEYYCNDISSSPPNHSWFEDKGRLSLIPTNGSRYNIIAGSTLFTGAGKAGGNYNGRYKSKYYEISIAFTERSKTGILIIVSEQNSSPVDIRFKCNKKSFLDRILD